MSGQKIITASLEGVRFLSMRSSVSCRSTTSLQMNGFRRTRHPGRCHAAVQTNGSQGGTMWTGSRL
jgi:hypothetical protein